MEWTYINYCLSHTQFHVISSQIWTRIHTHHSNRTCYNVPNSDWDGVDSALYTYTTRQLHGVRGDKWHDYSAKNQIHGTEIPLVKMSGSTTKISFLLGPWIQQLGQLQHQAPLTNLPWTKAPLICRRHSETVPSPSNILLKHQMQSCIYIFIWIYLFRLQQGCIFTILLKRVITIWYHVRTDRLTLKLYK